MTKFLFLFVSVETTERTSGCGLSDEEGITESCPSPKRFKPSEDLPDDKDPEQDNKEKHPANESSFPAELRDVQVSLEGRDLWDRFNELGTEMIITKSGR